MPTPFKSAIGLIGSVFPVVYCGYLIYYFYNVSGSVQEAENNGLGPTLLGLAIAGGLLCIPLIVKLVLVFIALRKPKAGGGGWGGSPPGADDKFDADAVVARYMAQRQAEAGAASSPLAHDGGGVPRPTFGRKNR